jgi:hypothetical protein
MRTDLRSALQWTATWFAVLSAAPALAASGGGGTCTAKAKVSPENQTVPESSLVTLNGKPSAPGNSNTYTWTQTGGTPVQLSDPHDAQPTFTAPNVGPAGDVLTFTLTVAGCSPPQTDSISTSISVTDVNSPPVASATVSPSTTVNEGDTVTLDGSASSDPNGDALTYVWVRIADGVPTTIATTAIATDIAPQVPYPDGASFTYRLTVSDGTFSNSTDKIVTVKWVNAPPVARISCPATVNEGDRVLLDGGASTDDEDGIASYAWSQLDGGPDSNLSSSALSLPIVDFEAPHLSSRYDTMKFQLIVTDARGLSSSAECDVQVLDVTPPVITGARDITQEAQSGAGATVSFALAAHDAVDGDVPVSCSPALDSLFPLGSTAVTCTASAGTNNTSTVTFNVAVVDTKPPSIAPHADIDHVEATGPDGAIVTYVAPDATDLVDGTFPAACTLPPGSTFPLGTTTVVCDASDRAGNHAASATFHVTVVDTTPPTVTAVDVTVEATGPAGAVASFTATATDLVDGSLPVNCTASSGDLFPLGETPVSCWATDGHANRGEASFTVKVVDTTPPEVTAPPDVTTGPTEATGAKVSYGAALAFDLVDGPVAVSCTPVSGSLFKFGTTSVSCTASDAHGNSGEGSFTVTVNPFTLYGFFQPVDVKSVNTVKNGSTVPLKWKLQGEGGVEITDVGAVASTHAWPINCGSLANVAETAIDVLTTTGGTSLRYDQTAMQFILNWQTPRQAASTCWRVDVKFQDGSALSAQFKLK